MGYAITTDPAHARLLVACDSPGSLADCLRVIHELGADERLRSARSVVIDARGLTWPVGLEDVQVIRASVRAETRPARPVAILSNPGAHFGAARQIATWLQSSGLTVEAFQQELDAEAWLRVMGRLSPATTRSPGSDRRRPP